MGTYYDKDISSDALAEQRIAIIGFGAQGRSHALNLHDSGADVVIALRADSPSMTAATSMGLTTLELEEAVRTADVVMLLSPDSSHPAIYQSVLEPHLRSGSMLLFAHGYSIHYETLKPRKDLDVCMVAPLGIGDQVRAMYVAGAGVPALLAVHQDFTGQAKRRALAYAALNGHGRAGIIETTIKDETETDLFAEQAILCGGITHLIEAGFETLVEAGYQSELAYFSCLHELKLIIDLIYSRGIAGMRQSISETAEFGDYTRGPRVINERTREEMRAMLKEVQSGAFARELSQEINNNSPVIRKGRAASEAHPITEVGERLRAMMPWIKS
ncbi:MAG: ketol-acid reductoisomerase [Gammaproteobacteria bacterium]|nr:ketol-acid reductoisomerase [Gammaproteobacteria bacterium]NNC96744.1 ketol-acid reductoisomerase [Gammaproteobacteria bacterium]NNM13982.1 ketol-acid reductoisomerase [Gammaproteobacteria bacterium]